mmetsp:Transcript_49640/g.124501  ORF Transcript_49640/g.124501 Transcript_49640/m.124501 type:complete len:216 (+) Transcript_49640:922-1569(+)
MGLLVLEEEQHAAVPSHPPKHRRELDTMTRRLVQQGRSASRLADHLEHLSPLLRRLDNGRITGGQVEDGRVGKIVHGQILPKQLQLCLVHHRGADVLTLGQDSDAPCELNHVDEVTPRRRADTPITPAGRSIGESHQQSVVRPETTQSSLEDRACASENLQRQQHTAILGIVLQEGIHRRQEGAQLLLSLHDPLHGIGEVVDRVVNAVQDSTVAA